MSIFLWSVLSGFVAGADVSASIDWHDQSDQLRHSQALGQCSMPSAPDMIEPRRHAVKG